MGCGRVFIFLRRRVSDDLHPAHLYAKPRRDGCDAMAGTSQIRGEMQILARKILVNEQELHLTLLAVLTIPAQPDADWVLLPCHGNREKVSGTLRLTKQRFAEIAKPFAFD